MNLLEPKIATNNNNQRQQKQYTKKSKSCDRSDNDIKVIEEQEPQVNNTNARVRTDKPVSNFKQPQHGGPYPSRFVNTSVAQSLVVVPSTCDYDAQKTYCLNFFDAKGTLLSHVQLCDIALDDKLQSFFMAVFGDRQKFVTYWGEPLDDKKEQVKPLGYKPDMVKGFVISKGVIDQDFLWSALSKRQLSVFRFITTRFSYEKKMLQGYVVKPIQYVNMTLEDFNLLKQAASMLTRVMVSAKCDGDKSAFFLGFVKSLVERESFYESFYEKFVLQLSMIVSQEGKVKLMASTIMYASTPIKFLESV